MLPRTSNLRSTLQYVILPPLRRVLISHTSSAPSISHARYASTESSHSSLSTFLTYAARTNLDRTSTTFAGTYYEYATQTILRRYGFNLDRVGGRGDRGVDLRGSWRIATGPEETTGVKTAEHKTELEIPVIVQCKRLKSKVGPNLIRELEGALAGRGNTLGVLVGTRGATRGVREAMGRSRVGVCWVMLEVVGEDAGGRGGGGKEVEGDDEIREQEESKEKEQGMEGVLQSMKDEIISEAPSATQEILSPATKPPSNDHIESLPTQLGRVRQMLWNHAASNMGLEGLDVVMKYDGTRDEDGETGKEVMLMWQGKRVEGLNGEEG
jgi:hypothetical protein